MFLPNIHLDISRAVFFNANIFLFNRRRDRPTKTSERSPDVTAEAVEEAGRRGPSVKHHHPDTHTHIHNATLSPHRVR